MTFVSSHDRHGICLRVDDASVCSCRAGFAGDYCQILQCTGLTADGEWCNDNGTSPLRHRGILLNLSHMSTHYCSACAKMYQTGFGIRITQ